MNNNPLINLMLEKSQESFLLAIEVYNKPTIKFRVEGFCFLFAMLGRCYLKLSSSFIHSITANDLGFTTLGDEYLWLDFHQQD